MTARLREKAAEDLCTRCGCCVSVCPQHCITLEEYPVITEGCTGCGLCENVCPSQGVDLKKTAEELFASGAFHEDVGYFINSYTGCALDDTIRERATSGGVVTSLLVYLLETRTIDGALVVTLDEEPLKTKYINATTREDIIKCAQTKYQITSVTIHADTLGEKTAVVGPPCVIHGMRKMQNVCGKKIDLLIGLFCWVNMEKEATEFLLEKLGIKFSEVESIEYRSGDYLGGFKVQLKNGTARFLGKECYNTLPLLFAPERCLLCCDFTNELADISVGDAKFMDSQKGHTFILTRSEKGETILKACENRGYIRTEPCNVEDIITSESSALFFKKRAQRRRGKKDYPHYGERECTVPLKNRIFEFIFSGVHRNRTFFRKVFTFLPLAFFETVSRVITKGRS